MVILSTHIANTYCTIVAIVQHFNHEGLHQAHNGVCLQSLVETLYILQLLCMFATYVDAQYITADYL